MQRNLASGRWCLFAQSDASAEARCGQATGPPMVPPRELPLEGVVEEEEGVESDGHRDIERDRNGKPDPDFLVHAEARRGDCQDGEDWPHVHKLHRPPPQTIGDPPVEGPVRGAAEERQRKRQVHLHALQLVGHAHCGAVRSAHATCVAQHQLEK